MMEMSPAEPAFASPVATEMAPDEPPAEVPVSSAMEPLTPVWPELGVRMTEAREHATELSRLALEDGAEMVISVGGDGTNNEVLGGFVDAEGRNRFPEAALGIVASGTGGDFQRMWGPLDPTEQVDRMARATLRRSPRSAFYTK